MGGGGGHILPFPHNCGQITSFDPERRESPQAKMLQGLADLLIIRGAFYGAHEGGGGAAWYANLKD